MNCFVTGATGFIGHELVKTLLHNGDRVNILVRTVKKLELPDSENLKIFTGDLSDIGMIEKGMEGCDKVFHLAAFANIWSENKNMPYEVNVAGTRNILESALKAGIKKVVFTSTAGVLKPSDNFKLTDETDPLPETFPTVYDETKYLAENLCLEYNQRGLNTVIVSPSKVYGPGKLKISNSLTRIIKLYVSGKWRFVPGNGEIFSNYVYIDDVVEGHIKAMAKGRPGEKYILGGINASFNQFLETLAKVSGVKRKYFMIPAGILSAVASLSLLLAEHFRVKPLITPAWLKKYFQNRLVSSQKAEEELGCKITTLEIGIQKTIQWLNQY